jgi:hypothetical protein
MRAISVVVVVLALSSARLSAWSFEAHRYITERAIGLLPAEIRPFYEKYRVVVVEHSIDPDLWRTVGFDREPPNHFLDLDAYGNEPFAALPRDYGAAVQRHGRATIDRNGRLPWRVVEIYEKLRGAFRNLREGRPGYAYDDVKFFAAVLSHYVADGHVPFHAVVNHDGQLTGQQGIHARFEEELFRRNRQTLVFAPRVVKPITAPRDFMFETLISGVALAGPVLEADRRAIQGRDAYDDVYFQRFFASARPALERRMSEAMAGVAAVIWGAWLEGGQPALPLEQPRSVRRVQGSRKP